MKTKFFLFILLFGLMAQPGNAQNIVVTGNVQAFDGFVLKNVKIDAKKTKTSTLTDSLGHFSIVCDVKDKLVFSGQGLKTETRKIKNGVTNVTVNMVFDNADGNENIDIGYGQVSEKDLTLPVKQSSVNDNDFSKYSDIFSLIQAKLGVEVVSGQGQKQVIIRGDKSFQLNSYAIYVVDGVITDDVSYININDVKSVNLMRDATIYGSRGANGAVIINTK